MGDLYIATTPVYLVQVPQGVDVVGSVTGFATFFSRKINANYNNCTFSVPMFNYYNAWVISLHIFA